MGHSTPACRTLEDGEVVLGRYRVLEQIAVGGHSVVYRGSDERLSRPVCIKVFDVRRSNPRVHETSHDHFVQEAFALSRLSHPATLRIYDFGRLDDEGGAEGAPVQVSEYIGGGTLSQLVRGRGPLPLGETVRIVEDLAGALSEAHEVGIVHRDVKPQNILFATAGETRVTKLADFGIAKALFLDVDLCRRADETDEIAGCRLVMYSPSWAAPEQLRGHPVGPAADLYSLALVAAYMLTARAVCRAGDVREGYERRVHVVEHLGRAAQKAGLAPAAVEVLARACALEPADRYPDVVAFARALAELPRAPLPTAAGKDLPRASALPPEKAASWRVVSPSGEDLGAVASRRLRFEPLGADEAVVEVSGVKFRVTLLPRVGTELSVHVKGINCFVALDGRPPTSAVTISGPCMIDFLSTSRARLARASVCARWPSETHALIAIGDEGIALPRDVAPLALGLDFGPGSAAVVLYTSAGTGQGAPAGPLLGRRR